MECITSPDNASISIWTLKAVLLTLKLSFLDFLQNAQNQDS